MDGTAVNEISMLTEEKATIEIDGLMYSRKPFSPIIFNPRQEAIEGSTITGMLDYLRANEDHGDIKDFCMIKIDDFRKLSLLGQCDGIDKKRTVYYSVSLDRNFPVFPFNEYIDVENFIIKARALMQHTDDLDKIISYVSRAASQNEISTEDDGISQMLKIKKGISGGLTTDVQTQGIYRLKPYRTFREVEQPESSFILRLKVFGESGIPKVALFDAEGDTWRMNAIESISGFIRELIADDYIPSIPVIA